MPDATHSQHLDECSFPDVPKMQTVTPLKSRKTEGCETEVRYHGGTTLAQGGGKPTVPTSRWISFDHFVGDQKHVGRYVEAYRLGGLEVDDELILGRKLDRQVARLGAAQDAIHVGWHAPIHIGEACSVFEQTAFLREI